VKLPLTAIWTYAQNRYKHSGGHQKTITVELFTWEKLDFVDQVKAACSSIHNKKRKPAQLSWFLKLFVYKLYFKEKTTYLG
jgi:hypothetical protein